MGRMRAAFHLVLKSAKFLDKWRTQDETNTGIRALAQLNHSTGTSLAPPRHSSTR